jgi:hypothetical protein
MTVKLNQIVALEKGLKGRTEKLITAIYHGLKKPDLFNGFSRTYQPRDDEGERFPAEGSHVQKKVTEELETAAQHLVRLFDVVVTKETGNTTAVAPVVVDGREILPPVPVTYLLFLEKELIHWRTMLSALPVLSSSERWVYEQGNGWYVTEPTETIKTKKTPKSMITAPATDRHPAQVHLYHEDVPIGTWTSVKQSAAISPTDRDALVERAEALIDAVKAAREEANGQEIEQVKVGQKVFDYLLQP